MQHIFSLPTTLLFQFCHRPLLHLNEFSLTTAEMIMPPSAEHSSRMWQVVWRHAADGPVNVSSWKGSAVRSISLTPLLASPAHAENMKYYYCVHSFFLFLLACLLGFFFFYLFTHEESAFLLIKYMTICSQDYKNSALSRTFVLVN